MTVLQSGLNSLKNNAQEVLNLIQQHEEIIILRHVRPDPDAIGAQIGFKHILKRIFPEKNIYALGTEEPSLNIIGYMDEKETFSHPLVIVLDTANKARIDGTLIEGRPVIKIDHHPNNDPYGDINLVETSVSSTSELIYILLNMWGYSDQLTDEAAKALYLGIVGDTGRFLFDNTSNRTHLIASHLKTYHFNATALMTKMSAETLEQFKYKSFLMQNFNMTDSGICYVYVSEKDLSQFNIPLNEASKPVNIFREIESVKVWFLAIEEDGIVRVRLRSKEIIINDIAEYFGGGGHPLASGLNIESKLELPKLIEAIEQKLK